MGILEIEGFSLRVFQTVSPTEGFFIIISLFGT